MAPVVKPHPYLVVVAGDLRATDREWLADLEIGELPDHVTALSGTLDQAALHGVLRRLQHLALDLVEVHRLCACRGAQRSTAEVLTVS